MRAFDFRQQEFTKLARMDADAVLATHQGSRIVVLGMEIPGTSLTTLFSIPPKGYCFGQDWWLGQSYWNWYLTAGFDEKLVEMILCSLKQSKLSIKRLPTNFLNLGGGIAREQGSKLTVWDTYIFNSITIPSTTVERVLKAFDVSDALVNDYLFVPNKGGTRLEHVPYGTVQIERAFSIGLLGTTYRNPMLQMLAKHGVPFPQSSSVEQENFLGQTIKDIDDIALRSKSSRQEILRGAHRWQYFYMLDAKDFEPDFAPLVVSLNSRRAHLLRMFNCPHFFSSVAIRLLDVSLNVPQKRYRYQPNDRDWLLRLQKLSPESLSHSFEELDEVDRYISAMRQQYPCLAEDPLHQVLPLCPVQKFK